MFRSLESLAATVVAGLLLLALLIVGVWGYLGHREARQAVAQVERLRTDMAKAEQEARDAKATREEEHRAAIDAIRHQHTEEQAHAQAAHDRLLADLRRGTVSLRRDLAQCAAAADLPDAAAGAGGADAGPGLRGASPLEVAVADQVRDADRCDARIRALQRVIESDRR